jgi:hypothetical protein
MANTGKIGINTLPSDHRMLILHNSTSGTTGSAQLALRSSSAGDFSRLQFENEGDQSHFILSGRATNGQALLNIYHSDAFSNANIMSFDGDNFRVGVHTETPEAYLHLRQEFAGVDVLAFQNSASTDKWSMRVGDEDILIYYNGGIRGGFDVSTGNYNNFPPAPPPSAERKSPTDVLDQVMQLNPIAIKTSSAQSTVLLDPRSVEKINSSLVAHSRDQKNIGLDYNQLVLLSIEAIQQRQEILNKNTERIEKLKHNHELTAQRLADLEKNIAMLSERGS